MSAERGRALVRAIVVRADDVVRVSGRLKAALAEPACISTPPHAVIEALIAQITEIASDLGDATAAADYLSALADELRARPEEAAHPRKC